MTNKNECISVTVSATQPPHQGQDTPATCGTQEHREEVEQRASHGVVHATVRATDEDDVQHIECRFADGQKYTAIETSGHKSEELAAFFTAALTESKRQTGEEVSDDAKRILQNLAKTREGCIALYQLVSLEFENISRLIDEAVSKCEAMKND